jgi:MFS family permease
VQVENGTDRSAASIRAVEIGVAVAILLFGLVVVFDSYRLGAKWGDDGPQPGYFPFYVGLLICISSLTVLVRGVRSVALAEESFVSRGELKKILTVLVPTVVYVSFISYLGFYVASTLYIAYFMWQIGKYSWLKTVPVSIGVSVAFFLIFEIWFQVPLPKGPLEAALGLG